MLLEKRIIAFAKLGEILRTANPELRVRSSGSTPYSKLAASVRQAQQHNGWFTEENILLALDSLGEMLREDKFRTWIKKYPETSTERSKAKRVGVIMAGNIPMVGFHDFLCVLMSGNIFIGKPSSEDSFLLPAIADILIEAEPEFKSKISFITTPIKSADAFIATGSNNSARYFEYYFAKHPHIIRKNRNSVAIINGKETETDLANLGKDIFQYFGMGCRNVSKLYIPKDYNLDKFFPAIVDFGDVINHNKYYNNHQYHRTIYLLNNEKFLDNNFLMLKESKEIASPVATLYYERYKDQKELIKKLTERKENIQCIVASTLQVSSLKSPVSDSNNLSLVEFGKSQSPELWDYADGVDTLEFLLGMK